MVSGDSVIPINGGFYTVDKLNPKQKIHGSVGLTFLHRIEYCREYGVVVSTDYFEVTVSPEQLFITDSGPIRAKHLRIGDEIYTSNGYEPVVELSNTEEIYDMFLLATEDGTFQANGFYLTNND